MKLVTAIIKPFKLNEHVEAFAAPVKEVILLAL